VGDEDQIMIATTQAANAYNGMNPTISLEGKTLITMSEYVSILEEKGVEVPHTKGFSIDGIITSSFWFLRKVRSVLDMFG
jgi:hypothetical protein